MIETLMWCTASSAIGGKNACLYFIDGFTKDDDTLLKLLQALSSIQADRMPKDAHSFSKQYLPYGEIGLIHESSEMVLQLLSGVSCLFIDGYDACLTIDCTIRQEGSVNRKRIR